MTDYRIDHRPILSDLRGIGVVEQDADIIIFLYRDEYYNIDTESKGITEVIVAKNYRGNVGTVRLSFFQNYVDMRIAYEGDMEIEITENDIDYIDIAQGIKYRCHLDFEKVFLKNLLKKVMIWWMKGYTV